LTKIEEKVREAVGKVVDPETGLTFADMHMIANVEEEHGVVKVDFIPSSPFCPIAFKLAMDVKNAGSRVAGIKKAYRESFEAEMPRTLSNHVSSRHWNKRS
jgi:metal-sulfur cluster biosynthetic enzyme